MLQKLLCNSKIKCEFEFSNICLSNFLFFLLHEALGKGGRLIGPLTQRMRRANLGVLILTELSHYFIEYGVLLLLIVFTFTMSSVELVRYYTLVVFSLGLLHDCHGRRLLLVEQSCVKPLLGLISIPSFALLTLEFFTRVHFSSESIIECGILFFVFSLHNKIYDFVE